MKIYLAYSGDINKHGHQIYDLIGVYQDKDMAIKVIEQSMNDVDMELVKKYTLLNGHIFWTENGMSIVTVGYLEVNELL